MVVATCSGPGVDVHSGASSDVYTEQIAHGSCEPLLGNVGEPEVCAVDHVLASVPARDELIPKGSRRCDPTRDSTPPLLASSVPEADLEDACATAIDVALHPLSTRGASCFDHD